VELAVGSAAVLETWVVEFEVVAAAEVVVADFGFEIEAGVGVPAPVAEPGAGVEYAAVLRLKLQGPVSVLVSSVL
jgi:hypothetical protein